MPVTLKSRSEHNGVLHELAGSDVVVVPVWNAGDETIRCVESLDRHTDSNVPFLFIDDRGEDRRSLEVIISHFSNHPRQVVIFDVEDNRGFVVACNTAFELTDSGLAIVNSDVVVGAEWFERLRQAATSSTDIATASALTNYGTILSLPERNSPDPRTPGGMSVDEAAIRVARSSHKLYPRIPVAIGHCMYINRVALNLVGGFDTTFGKGYGEEVDFSNRLRTVGLRHVCADDVFVFHKGSASFGEPDSPQKQANDRRITKMYSWYEPFVISYAEDINSPLAQALLTASLSLRDPKIAIDATSLGKFWAGTQQNVYNLVLSLAKARPNVQLTALVNPNITSQVVDRFKEVENLVLETVSRIDLDTSRRFDLVFRPNQINNQSELLWLKRIAHRSVVCQLDLISYHNSSYHPSADEWLGYRDLTHLTLATVDGATWISDFARKDAEQQGLSSGKRIDHVTYMGVDHQGLGKSLGSSRPKNVPDDGRPFLLQLGVAYHHKNRRFTLEVLGHLLDAGWDGRLVLVSAMPMRGYSQEKEASIHLKDKRLRAHVIEIGEVSEQERNWLVSRAALAIYPSIAEGFGLLPFEFARAGLPTLSSRLTSLAEIIPDDIEHIKTFDAAETAAQILKLLRDEEARASLVESLTSAGREFTWDSAARQTWNLFERVLNAPRNRVHAVHGDRLVVELFDHRPRYRNSKTAEKVESINKTVARARTNPLKRIIIPDGSRRQQLIRKSINGFRRRGLSH